MSGAGRIMVTPEGRDGIWIPERASLKEWIVAQAFEAIHNMGTAVPGLLLGGDHSVEGVLADIDGAERVALMTGAMRENKGTCNMTKTRLNSQADALGGRIRAWQMLRTCGRSVLRVSAASR